MQGRNADVRALTRSPETAKLSPGVTTVRGTEVTLSIWTGMPHVFQSSIGQLIAAEKSVDALSAFLRQQLG